MQLEPKDLCPLNNFEKCRQLDCAWFIKVQGVNPQTGKEVEEWGCAVAWGPIMTLEASRQARHTASAVESFRNEVVSRHEQAKNHPNILIKEEPSIRLIEGKEYD